eukprot:TRINITY_DN80356_c0_g1_i1.p1 TRINITY_DN80356_c0_g1~~TRINITY_DN80356_c0_g1_i1.p1  ORF type:complete len:305 (-),score=52.23 TRINITY_DN80356_c0_g1_i1:69-956(-)
MVSMVDETVKNVTAALKYAQLWNNTLLVVVGDNGSPVCGWGAAGSNAPFRGGKASNWEGGVRTFGFLAGGILPEAMRGKALDGMVHISDFYKTFLSLAGDPHAADHGGPTSQDSVDVSDYLFGVTSVSPRQEIVHDHFSSTVPTGAIRVGDWKLLVGKQTMATWFGSFSPNMSSPSNASAASACESRPCLFNIRQDPTEHEDLIESEPKKAAELLERFHSYNAAYHPPGPKGSDLDGYCTAAAANHGFMVPWRQTPVTDALDEDTFVPSDLSLGAWGSTSGDLQGLLSDLPSYVI